MIIAFLKGIDRKDERVLFNVIKSTDFDPADRVIRKGTKDRSIIFIGGGQFMAFKEQENEVYTEGAILGINEFINDAPWKYDIICSKGGYICKLQYESMLDMINSIPINATHSFMKESNKIKIYFSNLDFQMRIFSLI